MRKEYISTWVWVLLITFAILAIAVRNGWTQGFDSYLVECLRPASREVEDHYATKVRIAQEMSAWASTTNMIFVVLLVVVVTNLLGRDESVLAAPTFMAVILSSILDVLWKHIIQRDRPPANLHLTYEEGFSFPSGHASAVSAFCLSILLVLFMKKYVIINEIEDSQMITRQKSVLKFKTFSQWAIWMSITVVTLVCFSRVILQVHYPTDVVAGVINGSIAALLTFAPFAESNKE